MQQFTAGTDFANPQIVASVLEALEGPMTLEQVKNELAALEILNRLRRKSSCSKGNRLLYSAALHIGSRLSKHWLILGIGARDVSLHDITL